MTPEEFSRLTINDLEQRKFALDGRGDLLTLSRVGNISNKLRDFFTASGGETIDPGVWEVTNEDHLTTIGGNSSGSSYLRITLDPRAADSEFLLISKDIFMAPFSAAMAVSMSQRILGRELFVGLAGVDAQGQVELLTASADRAITGANITIASNVATVTMTDHGFNGGDRVSIYGCVETRLNVTGVVTVIDKHSFTIPCTLANGTYSTTGGMLRYADPFRLVKNGAGYLFENTTVTNASCVLRSDGAKYRSANQTVATTTGVQANTSPYTDAFNAASIYEIDANAKEVSFRSLAADVLSTPSGVYKNSQGIKGGSQGYKLMISARNLPNMTRPVARIASIAKTGTTTATVVTDTPHGLSAGNHVQIYGVRDQTNFPNLTSQTAVASVVDAVTFTIVIGTATTNSSAGGAVFLCHGSVTAPGIFAQAVQSASRTGGVLTLIGSGTWATPLPGEFVLVYGLEGSLSVIDGMYKVLRVSTTTLELEAPGEDFVSANSGGAVMRCSDMRLHFVRLSEYAQRHAVEITGGRGNTADINNSVPVSIVGGATLTVTANTTPVPTASSTNALTRHRRIATASTNAVSVKTSAGRIYRILASNLTASPLFLKIYSKASAPTVGTDTPIETYALPANTTLNLEFGEIGNYVATGIAYAITGAIGDGDTTATTADAAIINMFYL